MDLQSDPEFVSMFLFHNVEPLEMEGEREVILSKVGPLTVPVPVCTYIQVRILFLKYLAHCTYVLHWCMCMQYIVCLFCVMCRPELLAVTAVWSAHGTTYLRM